MARTWRNLRNGRSARCRLRGCATLGALFLGSGCGGESSTAPTDVTAFHGTYRSVHFVPTATLFCQPAFSAPVELSGAADGSTLRIRFQEQEYVGKMEADGAFRATFRKEGEGFLPTTTKTFAGQASGAMLRGNWSDALGTMACLYDFEGSR